MSIKANEAKPSFNNKTWNNFQDDLCKYQNCRYLGDYPLISVILDDIFILMEYQKKSTTSCCQQWLRPCIRMSYSILRRMKIVSTVIHIVSSDHESSSTI